MFDGVVADRTQAQGVLHRAVRMGQRHKHLTPTKAPFPNVILHDGLFAREAMFVAKALEYSVPARSVGDVQEVEYGGSRFVKASEVAAMLDGDDEARAMVDQSVLLRKAESWSYEQEWRLIGRRGTQNSPLELEEVIFGMRCKESGKYIVMRALEKCKGRIKFHEMREERGTFNLTKHELSYEDERFVHFPRRHLSLIEGFEAVSVRDAGMREE